MSGEGPNMSRQWYLDIGTKMLAIVREENERTETMERVMKMVSELGLGGFVEIYQVAYTPHRRSDSQIWYTFETGRNSTMIQEKMDARYPTLEGYQFERVWSVPSQEEIIPPPGTPVRA